MRECKEIRVMIIGTGTMAHIYADIINDIENADLAVVVGNTKRSSEKFSVQYNVPVLPDMAVETALNKFDVNFIILATPEWVRLEPIKQIVKYNLPILLEKPFCIDFSEAKEIANLLSGTNQFFNVCHVLRSNPRFDVMLNEVNNGAVGTIKNIYARRNSNSNRVERVLGKFPLTFWLLPHDLDMVLRLLREPVSTIFCQTTAPAYQQNDCLTCVLKMKSGSTVTIENSWVTPPISNTSTSTIFEVSGTNGKIELTDDNMNVKVFGPDMIVNQPDTSEHYRLNNLSAGYFTNFLKQQFREFRNQSQSEKLKVINHCLELTKISELAELSRLRGAVVEV